MQPIEEIKLADIRAAQQRIKGIVVRTPLVPLNVEGVPASIYLKLENVQPIGSFKLRGAANALALAEPETLTHGVYTASAGNMAQGLAYAARRLGVECSVVVPDNAPATKLAAVERLGGKLIKVAYDTWWQVIKDHHFDGLNGRFIHPVADPAVIAGNGTIGLEIMEDLPEVDTIIAPYGGGGLSSGIASAVKAIKPDVKVFACEPETAAPLAASLRAGSPQTIEHTRSFVDGMGGKSLLREMWPLARTLIDKSIVVSLKSIAEAIKLLIERNRIVAEGAGAGPVAAALSGEAGSGTIVCIVSGGNIDTSVIARILNDEMP